MHAPIIPTLRYANARKAIDWLCEAFAFEKHLVVPGDGEDEIAHAQLTYRGGMIMLGTERDDEFGALQKSVGSVGGVTTQSPYIIVPDADEHHARAVKAGAKIVTPLYDADYGGRGYGCKDPEGHLWNFGTYDPWAETQGG